MADGWTAANQDVNINMSAEIFFALLIQRQLVLISRVSRDQLMIFSADLEPFFQPQCWQQTGQSHGTLALTLWRPGRRTPAFCHLGGSSSRTWRKWSLCWALLVHRDVCPQEREGSRSLWMVRDVWSTLCLPKPRTISLVLDPEISQCLMKKILPDTSQHQTRQPCPGHFTLIETLKCRTPALSSSPSRVAEWVTDVGNGLLLNTFCNCHSTLCTTFTLPFPTYLLLRCESLCVLLYKHSYFTLGVGTFLSQRSAAF